jgi:protein O-GlcNAc transferase
MSKSKEHRVVHPPKPPQSPEIANAFQQALALHQQGQLAQAGTLYRTVLERAPQHFNALHFLGVIEFQLGHGEAAARLIGRAVTLDPKFASAHANLGLALSALGRHGEALASFDRALALEPGDAVALGHRGNVLRDLLRPAEAVASYDRALALKPDQIEVLNNRGLALHDLERHEQALASYDRALALRPDLAVVLYNRGNALRDLERHEQALASYDRALALEPNHGEALNNRGNVLRDLDRPADALASYDRALALRPDYAEAHYNRGRALRDLERLEEALASYDRALALKPDHVEALNNRANALRDLDRPEEALASYDRALAVAPDHAEAFYNRGNALRDLKRDEEALASYDRALAVRADYAEALNNRGNALLDLKRHEEAVASYDRALAIAPDNAETLINRGNALRDLKRYEDALASYGRALALKPDYAEALNNSGVALMDLKRPEQALASYDRALAIKSDYADVLNNRGNALLELRRPDEALASYDRALALRPDYADALNNRGNALNALNRPDEAIASFGRALAVRPDHADALSNRGSALNTLKRYDEAARDYERLLILKPDYDYTIGNMFSVQLGGCDWRDRDRTVERIAEDVVAGKRAINPLIFLSASQSPADQLQCARTFNQHRFPPSRLAPRPGERHRHDRLRVAYVSADYRGHPVAFLTAGLFEAHDRSRFETIAISLGPDTKDAMRTRLEGAFERFIDVRGQSDRDAALLLSSLEIDIAVDLNGYTQDCRTGILAFRPAPIQVNFLGYPGTMGADYIDYILADRIIIPEDQDRFYAEKVVRLPDTYMPNDQKRRISEHTPSRAEAGLPETGFVFCAFNANYKIAPRVFDVWMRLLRAVEGSVLWLRHDNAIAVRNLRREAESRGVASDRLVFAPLAEKLEDHLARQRLAGIFLDTLPYNAHATASDALWAGLPVVSCLGASFAGRVAASLLKAVGLPELVADTLEDYEALALALARDETALAAVKAKLARNRETLPLFDTDRFCRHVESAYETMWRRHQRGEPPAGFAVAPSPTR